VNLLAFSDLHCDLETAAALVERSRGPEIHGVIGAGDFASVHAGLEQTIDALSEIEKPALLVPGNNETEDALRAASARWRTASVIHHNWASILDGMSGDEPSSLSLWGLGGGIPTTPWDWSFDLSEEEATERLDGCPEGLDLLVLHSPPYGHCDVSGGGQHLGSRAILEAIEQKQPRIAVCGHIHESWGEESTIGATRLINLGPAGRVIEV
jgi:uncharacterized protein